MLGAYVLLLVLLGLDFLMSDMVRVAKLMGSTHPLVRLIKT